jgi:glycosyltransferase involved in cell wall biosynthesis
MKFRIESPVVVITPTVGSDKLKDAVESVHNQTYKNITHLLVVDGTDHFNKTVENTPLFRDSKVQMLPLPFNTGANGFYGHRIYAGIPHLVNADYVFFLDEDNWYLSDHVETLVETLEQGNDFAYSLRKIFDENCNYVCDDNCESLGKWPIYFSHNDPQYLVDTSSFAFKREFIQATCHLWHSGWGGDRRYLYSVKDNAKFDTSGKHTLCYRTDGNPGSVKPSFFIEGNALQAKHYNNNFPWIKNG